MNVICSRCGKDKPEDEFPRNRNYPSGRHCHCKPCHNEQVRASRRKHGGSRHYHLRGRYGITSDEKAALVERQGGLCACCRKRPAEQVDHDHKTGRVRGILCLTCNTGMGGFRDDPDVIRRAIAYLEKHRGVS